MAAKKDAGARENGSGWLGYTFRNPDLLQQALTHGSSKGAKLTYERLEFLGDRVLSLVIAEALFHKHATETEGKLAARHSALVKGSLCADISAKLGLADRVIMGAAERKLGVQKMQSVLGDVVEAVIGAIYLDAGFDQVREFVLANWGEAIANPTSGKKDPKTLVQEWVLAKSKELPAYELVGRTGPEHQPEFLVRLNLGRYGSAEGRGPSKQAAERSAAQNYITERGLR